MFEKEAEEYVMREDVITENDRVPFDNGYGFQTVSFEDEVKKGFKDGAEFGYNKVNEWHFVKGGDLPKKDCELIILHENGHKNIQKWENGNWTNAILIPIIAWKEIVLPELPKELDK